jgi:hypothetical protein
MKVRSWAALTLAAVLGCTLQLGPRHIPARPAAPDAPPVVADARRAAPAAPAAPAELDPGLAAELAGSTEFWLAMGGLCAAVGGVWLARRRRAGRTRQEG